MTSITSLSRKSASILATAATVLLACLPSLTTAKGAEVRPDTIRVMTFNLWHGGDAGQQPLDQTVEVIKQSRADIVGLQETAGNAPKGEPRPDRAAEIAKRLGWHYLDQGERTGIISRFEIVGATPRKWGVKIKLPSGRQVYAFNAHFAASPYQPYQLLNIPYNDSPFLTTAGEAIQAAKDTHGKQVKAMLSEIRAEMPEGLPMFITGDFNEPSHLDWTEASVRAKHAPIAVEWPTTRAVVTAGFVDAFRQMHPDPVKARGLTWTPITRVDDPRDRHDRIDFVFAGAADRAAFEVKGAQIVGESKEFADVVVDPYPSDHRAVVAEIELKGSAKP